LGGLYLNRLGNSFKIFAKETDKLLLFLCLLASAFGVLMVYSATLNKLVEGKSISRDTLIMIIAITLGLVLCFLISLIDYAIILRMWPIIAAACLLLMFSLFIWGKSPNGRSDAKSWLHIAGMYFQPSELLKIGFVLTFTVHLDTVKNKLNELKTILLLGIHGLIPIGLVILTGDLGSALVFASIISDILPAELHWVLSHCQCFGSNFSLSFKNSVFLLFIIRKPFQPLFTKH
jgi:rod shape determining protein RodA